MYKVLLVDDEPWSLISIKNAFNWHKYGFSIAAETTNSRKAFEILKEELIHVAFVDIRMPEISGLDLIRIARSKGIDTEFVIISGFAEFSYAQQALQDGVFDYCLKPVNEETTDVLLNKLSEHLKLKQVTQDTCFFDMLLEEDYDIVDLMNSRKFKVNGKYTQVLSIRHNDNCKGISDAPCIMLPPNYNFLEIRLSLEQLVYIVNSDNPDEFALEKYYNAVNKSQNLNIGLSSISTKITDIPLLLRESFIAVNKSFVDPYIYVNKYKTANYNEVKSILEEIISLLELKKLSDLKKYIKNIPNNFIKNDLGVEEAAFLWNQISAYISKKSSNSSILIEYEFLDYKDLIDKFDSLKHMCFFLNNNFKSIEDKIQLNSVNNSSSENFKQLLEYINNNYTKNLQLKDLAKNFYINFTYCSELFKKVTGTTFSQYITRLRMKRASELLLNTDFSIHEICKKTGYKDYYYFNNVFKRYFNVTPSKYRKINF